MTGPDLATQPPLVITLALDAESQAFFQLLRTRHFPAARNRVPAHLSLFHALPGDQQSSVLGTLRASCRRPLMPLEAIDIMKLGRGVAYRVEGDGLHALHDALRQVWWPWLTQQDRQGFRPHVVIQNKVEPAAAKALYAQLAATFRPFPVVATGILLWRYLEGPWELVETVPFAGSPILE